MATKIGVGHSKNVNAFAAGCEAAQAALTQAGTGNCDFVFMFATVGYNQEELLKGVRSITKEAPLSGCTGEGIITQAGPEGEVLFSLSSTDMGTDIIGVMVFSSDEFGFINFVEKEVKGNSLKAGEAIGKKINTEISQNPLLLFMFPVAYSLNMRQVFSSIEKTLTRPLLISGGMAGHNFTLSAITYQYHNDQVLTEAIPCVLIHGNVKVDIGVNHGCLPVGIGKKVTRAEANTIYEIENKPTWSFFQEYLGDDVKELNSENSPSISIGEKLSEAMATEYDKYIIHAPFLQNPDGSVIFATETPEGATIQLMRRDDDKISQGAKNLAERMKSQLAGKKPLAVLHFDCAGRGKQFFGDRVKEKSIDVIQDVLGKDIPWLGIFSFGEIAPIMGKNYFHNHTVVLCVIYQ